MGVITLTTDLGHRDFYQAALKGSIISQLPDVRLVDITHEIPSFDIQRAAVVLRNAFRYFPKGTVHIIGIDTVFQEDSHYAMMKFDDHFFVGADNGIFSIILGENDPPELYEIDIMQDLRYLQFPLADILCNAACHIAQGEPLSEMGQPIDKPLKKVLVQPWVGPSTIKGH